MKVYNDNQLYQSPAGDQLRNSGRQNWIFGRIGDQEGAISDPDYAWSAVNDVKRLQTGYIKNFRYLMTTGCGNTIVSRWRCHSRGRKHRDQAIKWIRSNSEIAIPPKRAQSPPKITKSRHSRKSYVLQDFRKLGMGIEIIVKGVFWSIVTIGFALGWRERNSSLFQCTRICYNWKQDRTQTWTSTV